MANGIARGHEMHNSAEGCLEFFNSMSHHFKVDFIVCANRSIPPFMAADLEG